MKNVVKWVVSFAFVLGEFLFGVKFDFPENEAEIQKTVQCIDELCMEQFKEGTKERKELFELRQELVSPFLLFTLNCSFLRNKFDRKFHELWGAATEVPSYFGKNLVAKWNDSSCGLRNMRLA